MKKKLILLLVCLFPCITFAQSIKYSYDNAGNRIKREIVIITRSSYEDHEKLEDLSPAECFSDKLSEKDIRIHTDQVNGRLRIEIIDYDNADECSLQVFSISGHQVFSTHVTSSFTEVDINYWTNGIFFLYISLNGKETTWKIIKK